MYEHTTPMLANRLNHEPVVVLGCNSSEVTRIATACTLVGAVAAIPMGIVLGASINASVGLFLGFVTFFLCSLGGSCIVLQKLQQNKEAHGDHYYRELLHCWLSDVGLGGTKVHQQTQRYVRGKPL